MRSADTGLQPERTRLAWQRTTLTAVAALLVALRLLVGISPGLAAVATVAAGAMLVIPIWSAARWQLAHSSLDSVGATDGRAPALLAVLVGLCSLAALTYALLR